MKILAKHDCQGVDSIEVEVFEHADAPGEGVLSISRGGVGESQFTHEELGIIADTVRAAQIRLKSKARA